VRALPHGETITILRPGTPTRDAYGNDVPGAPTETVVPGCGLSPTSVGGGNQGAEILQARDTVITGLTLYAPTGTDLRATDRVLVDGALYDVDGPPGSFASPFTGSTGPVVAVLQQVEG
jgi:hypothetical protein